jgi:hypothetical protein
MKNVTLSLDEEVHRAARLLAAERGVSLSALVRDLLAGLRPPADPRRDAVRQALAAMDAVKGFSASNRLTREVLHER